MIHQTISIIHNDDYSIEIIVTSSIATLLHATSVEIESNDENKDLLIGKTILNSVVEVSKEAKKRGII